MLNVIYTFFYSVANWLQESLFWLAELILSSPETALSGSVQNACQGQQTAQIQIDAFGRQLNNLLDPLNNYISDHAAKRAQKKGLGWDAQAVESEYQEERKIMNLFAAHEYVGHHLAYRDLQDGEVYPIPNEKGELENYTAYYIQDLPAGLVATLLLPNDPNHTDCKVLFRGTNSWAAVWRDLDEDGAGHASFEQAKETLIAAINQKVGELRALRHNKNQPLSFTFAGHSLGGADAAGAMTAMMLAIAENKGYKPADLPTFAAKSRDNLDNISKLTLFICNSAGVSKTTKDSALELAKFLKTAQPSLALNMQVLIVEGDLVQQTGAGYLFSRAENNLVNIDLLQINFDDTKNRMRIDYIQINLLKMGLVLFCIGTGAEFNHVFNTLSEEFSKLLADLPTFYRQAHVTHFFTGKPVPPYLKNYERLSNQNQADWNKINGNLDNHLGGWDNYVLSMPNFLGRYLRWTA